jgi:hypothetical protein
VIPGPPDGDSLELVRGDVDSVFGYLDALAAMLREHGIAAPDCPWPSVDPDRGIDDDDSEG